MAAKSRILSSCAHKHTWFGCVRNVIIYHSSISQFLLAILLKFLGQEPQHAEQGRNLCSHCARSLCSSMGSFQVNPPILLKSLKMLSKSDVKLRGNLRPAGTQVVPRSLLQESGCDSLAFVCSACVYSLPSLHTHLLEGSLVPCFQRRACWLGCNT